MAADQSLKAAVHEPQSTLSDLSDTCWVLWESSYMLVPEIVESKACWSPSPPDVRTIFTAFLEPAVYSKSKFLPQLNSLLTYQSGFAEAFENEERSEKHGEAIWQLQHPNKENSTNLMNAKLQLPDDSKLCVPTSVLSKRTPYEDLIFDANLTLRHTIVDLHIDQEWDELIVCIEDSKKIVLMWPATNSNMNLLRKCSYHQANLFWVEFQLEGSILSLWWFQDVGLF